ncbi:cytochrome P450 4c3-like [Vespa crabro]|uniref:cytochrome P450 4c3-like n=1 Tax=Vespa crabro TaxID=7445 RepID=UPI001F0006EA|nr:cytochrome P450 4c3-like [Vespa crabro]
MSSAIQLFFDGSWITLILSSCLLLMILTFAIQRGQFIYAVRNIPQPISLPIIGNAYQLNSTLEEFFTNLVKWSHRFGDIFLVWVGIRPFIFLYKVETVQPLLSSRIHINKSFDYKYLNPWLGNGLITSNGEVWYHSRKLLTPTFHSGLLEDYLNSATNEVKIMISCLKKEIGKSFDIVPYAKRAMLDVICDSAMEYQLNAQTNFFNEYVLAVTRMSQIMQYRFTNVWTSFNLIFRLTKLGREHDHALKVIHSFVDKIIAERKQEWINNQNDDSNKPIKKHRALLDFLLEISKNGTILTDTNIRDEVNTFMFAGHDTTATSISWILYALGRRPEYQEQILDEYDEIVGDKEITLETLNKLVLLDACIKESWRLYPVVPLIARQIYNPIKILGHNIPVGSTVLINSYLLHRDVRYFPDPDVYKPERFLPSSPKLPSYTFIPFSAGSRNCIGSKFATIVVKVFILSILKSYHIESLITEDKLRLISELVLVNKDGIKLKITPRTR